jgi:hypothetical protein
LLDLDFAHPTAHASKKPLIPGPEEAMEIIAAIGLDPSIVVNTGHGWHVYWLFKKPWILTTAEERAQAEALSKAFQKQFIDEAARRGWHVDSTATIQRVWRVPGFVNCKSGAACELVHLDSTIRYELDELVPLSLEAMKVAPVPSAVSLAVVRASLSKLSPDSKNKAAIEKILAGESFADSERDNAMQSVCSTIAWIPEAAGMPASELVEILRPSLSVWAAETDNPKRLPLDEEMAKALDKIQRAQQDKIELEAKEWEDLKGLREALGDRSPGVDKVSPESKDFVLHHCIIQYRDGYYIYNFDEQRYSGLKRPGEVLSYARRAWQSVSVPSVDYFNAKGEIKIKQLPQLMKEYGDNADEVIGKFYLTESIYNCAQHSFEESVAPLRTDLTPRYDEQIAHWLKLLAGPLHDKVLDWIACVTKLKHPCCALYLDGISGAGKGLLAAGLAKLWHPGGPTSLANVMESFNADQFRCPLVFLDEGLDKKKASSSLIRSLVGAGDHTYKEKNLPNRPVLGSIRLLIAANNDNVLAFGDENLSVNDLIALEKRFLHVHAQQEAADWLEANNPGGELTKTWVADGCLIARHALWLVENRVVKYGKRFLVEGGAGDSMHRKIVMQGASAGLVYEWLVRFASNPKALYQFYRTKKETPRARIGDNIILVNTQGLLDSWETYMGPEIRRPSTTSAGQVLRKLSEGSRKLGPRHDRVLCHQIQPTLVTGWASDNQIGNDVAMRRNLNTKLEDEEKNTLEII